MIEREFSSLLYPMIHFSSGLHYLLGENTVTFPAASLKECCKFCPFLIGENTLKRILTIAIIIVAFSASNAQEAAFQGQIHGIDSTEISVMILPLKQGEIPILKKINCAQGKFECTIKFDLNMWHLVRLNSTDFHAVFGKDKSSKQKLKNREIIFFIQPNDHLSISAEIRDYGIGYQIVGNELNKQRNLFAKSIFSLEEEFNRLTISNEKTKEKDGMNKEIEDQISLVNIKMDSIVLKTIVEHPDWIYSAEKLAGFPEDTIAKYFKHFTADVQNSFFGIHLSKILNAVKIGSVAPEFTLKDKKGKTISLSDFSGKYIVLDFWGTWCGYCMKGIPRMKKYFSKYQNKTEFICVACRDNKQAWLKSIAKYDLDWINLFAENEEIVDKYGVEGYPTKIIIDQEGKIAFKSTGESDEFYDKMDEIFHDVP